MVITNISIYPPKNFRHVNGSGVAAYTKNLVTNIPYNKSDEVFVLCNKIDNNFESYKEGGINIVRCFDKNPLFILQLIKEIKRIKPELVHIQQELSLYGGVVTALLLQLFILLLGRIPKVITLHGVVSIKKIDKTFVKENNSYFPVFFVKIAFLVIYKPLCFFVNKIIVHEEIFKKILIEEYGVQSNKITTIHLGIEDLKAQNKQEACLNLNLSPDRDIILFMGYLTGYKGLDLLIEGFSLYSKENKNSYLIIGAGLHPKLNNDSEYLKEYSRIKKKAEDLINPDCFSWLGFINEKDIENYYSAADVSIYPYTSQISSSGPMGIAISYEKPFLASDVFDNFIDNKKMLFNRNPESLSQCLSYFFLNKQSFFSDVRKLKESRLCKTIGVQTYNLYKDLQ